MSETAYILPVCARVCLCVLLKIARLRSELDIVRGNCKVMSEMLTEMVPGQEDASDLELLQVLNPIGFPFHACVHTVFFSHNDQSWMHH